MGEENSITITEQRKQIMDIAGPVLIELLLGSLFGMVDMIMLGNYGDPISQAAGIAAVGVTNQIVFIGMSLVQALNTGATAMVARYLGAGKEEKVQEVLKHIIFLTQIFLVIPVLIFGWGFTNSAMKFAGAGSDVISIGRNYFRIILFGFIFQALNFSIFATMRGAGDTVTPMKINVAVNLLNVIGNAILIYGLFGLPELGVTGAAVSTSLSHIIASLILLRHVLDPESKVYIDFKEGFKISKDIAYNLVRIGVPASLEQIALRAGLLIFVKIIAGLGTVAYATHQIAVNILSLSFTPGQAFGIAAATLTGKSLGAEKPKLANSYILKCTKVGTILSTLMAFIFFFFGKNLASLYTENPDVIKEAASVLKLVAFIQPFQSSQLILSGGLRGAGDTMWTLVSTFIGILVVRVALAYYFVNILGWGLLGAWGAVFIDQLIRWMIILYRFRSEKWKYITIR